MTDPATGPVAAEVTARLTRAFAPSLLQVVNDSHHHAGHMGDDGTGESHFTVTIESAAFAGKSRVEQQRMVNRELADLLAGRIHALAIRTRVPAA
ncbi:BolA family transcriptional regulator [Sphingomonas sp. BGYR3]|uniref:BolA family protein n=1 Tax=Sphingomonas sp. BGYR3 TaxID=2975483 RepID=UPI0021A7AA10|nr:BolA family protein [Sphingomonas sp. BGYR3]MDG5489285.1 BolA family transcriptional regulator [Sphingomonas sp. BGYR3]